MRVVRRRVPRARRRSVTCGLGEGPSPGRGVRKGRTVERPAPDGPRVRPSQDPRRTRSHRERARVVIAGAGVAGLEAALALQHFAPGRAEVELIDPGERVRLEEFRSAV